MEGWKVRDASLALGLYRTLSSEDVELHPKVACAAGLASLTAESLGGLLHTFSTRLWYTLLVTRWTTRVERPQVVLMSRPMPTWDGSIAFWYAFRRNELLVEQTALLGGVKIAADIREPMFTQFIRKSTIDLWHRAPAGSPVRWAMAADLYLRTRRPRDAKYEPLQRRTRRVARLRPKFLGALGYPSLRDVGPEFGGKEGVDQLCSFMEHIVSFPSRSDEAIQMGTDCIARPLPNIVPVEVLQNRGDLSLAQALALYLTEQWDGPRTTHAVAATLLGMKSRQEIATHLKRARNVLGPAGLTARRSGLTEPEYPGGDVIETIDLDRTEATG